MRAANRALDFITGAGLLLHAAIMAGVMTTVDTVLRRVAVVALALAAVGWGTAGAGLETAGQLETIVVLHVVVVAA